MWAGSLALYLSTLAPTLTSGYNNTGEDGGELLAAANTFGIPHPPGYPTYTLLLKSFATMVPIGDFAYRGNLLSAVLASLSVALLFWVILRFCRFLRPDGMHLVWITSAAVGAAVFATSPLLWSQAVMTEVYTLNTLFVGALLLIASSLALRQPLKEGNRPSPTTTQMALFGLLLGLGLGNHLTLLAVAVPLLFWLWATLGWRQVVFRWSVGAFILGLGIYIYLPIRAAQDPPVDWGNANTIGGMAWMVSARVYQDYVFGVPAGAILGRVLDWVELVFTQLNPLGIFLGIMAIAPLRTREWKFLAASLASMVALSVYSITYHTVDSEVLTIPAFMLFSVWVGIGVQWVISGVSDWVRGSVNFLTRHDSRATPYLPALLLGVVAFGALPVTSVLLNYGAQDLGGDTRAYDYAREIMDMVPDGSLVLSTEEGPAFSMWYMRYVEDTDRDVAPIAVPLLQFEWYWEDRRGRFPDRVPPEATTDLGLAVQRIVQHNDGGSRVFFTYRDLSLDESFTLERIGRLYEARVESIR